MTIPSGYSLIFSDEFIGTTLDTTKWFYSSSVCDYDNLPANVSLDGNSNVVFKCSDATHGGGIATVCDKNGASKFNFTYGYVEIMAKLQDTNQIPGIASDMWMNGMGSWPPEIDITETGSGPYNTFGGINTLNMTRHCCADKDSTCDGTNEGSGYNCNTAKSKTKTAYIKDTNGNPINLSKDFHVYGLEWTSTFVRWLLDDVEYFRVTTGIPKTAMYFTTGIYPGDFLGDVQPNTPFPTYMYVDYVRIYQRQQIPALGSISIAPTNLSVNVGQNQQITATCKDTTDKIVLCPILAWNSSNTSVATVDNNGIVKGIAVGTANISASSSGITSNTSIVNVTDISVTELLLNPGFEIANSTNPSKPENWSTKYYNSVPPTGAFIYPATGMNGGKGVSIKFPASTTSRSYWYQKVNVVAGKQYSFSVYVLTSNIVASSGYGARMIVDWFNGTTYLGSTSKVLPTGTNSAWSQYNTIVTAMQNADNANVILQLGNCSGQVWYDNVSFKLK